MRSIGRVILPALLSLVTVACSAGQEDVSPEPESEATSPLTGCSLSRDKIMAAASAGRKKAVQRGFAWLDDDVPYSQSASHEGYRTDCSGFVSMCWSLGRSSNTSAFYSGDANKRLGSYDDLVVADALVKQGHVVLFLGWNDAAKTGACVLEQASTASDMQFRVRTRSSLVSDGYKAIRANSLAGETAPEPTACVPLTAQAACTAAKTKSGVECGRVSDGCKGTVDCDTVASFGCEAEETCTSGRCVAKACVPKTAAETCAAARSESSVACGTVTGSCGEMVDCDDVPGFGCSAGTSCSAEHRCEPGADDTSSVTTQSEESGDPGDPDEKPVRSAQRRRSSATELQSGGCSAAPGGSASGSVLPLLAVLLVLARRRRAD